MWGEVVWCFSLSTFFIGHRQHCRPFYFFRTFSNIFPNMLTALCRVYIIIPINVLCSNYVIFNILEAKVLSLIIDCPCHKGIVRLQVDKSDYK